MIVYSRENCAPCATLKYWLERKGIAFEERPPDASIRIFPTVEIDGQRIEGLNIPLIARLLEGRV